MDSTSTTLPLLSTVLAGFSLSGLLALISTAHVNFKDHAFDKGAGFGLLLLGLAIPTLLLSTTFAVWAQGYTYLGIDEDRRTVESIPEDVRSLDYGKYIAALHQNWARYYHAALLTYYLGSGLFAGGSFLLIGKFLGLIPMIIYAVVIGCGLLAIALLRVMETPLP